MQQIVLGNGSNDVLELAAQAFLAPGRSAVYSQHAFAVYPLATQARGAESIVVPAKHFGHDLEAMLAAIRPDTRIVFIANPNNPTGTCLPRRSSSRSCAGRRRTWSWCSTRPTTSIWRRTCAAHSIAWVGRFPNLIVTRTFSKVYGLAGLRVGYARVPRRRWPTC